MVRERYRVSIKRLGPPANADPGIFPGLASSYFHGSLKEGDIVDVKAPAGGFHLDTVSERPAVFIAGGIGLTPVLSMFKWLADTGSRRTAWFFLAVRNGNDIALRDEIRDAANSNKQQFHTVTLYSDPTEQCVEGQDYDCKGFLNVDVLKRYLKTSNYEFYICGPPPMMEATVKALLDWGVPEADIHFEAFGPASVKGVQKRGAERSSCRGQLQGRTGAVAKISGLDKGDREFAGACGGKRHQDQFGMQGGQLRHMRHGGETWQCKLSRQTAKQSGAGLGAALHRTSGRRYRARCLVSPRVQTEEVSNRNGGAGIGAS